MNEFNTIEKVKELFESINAVGSDNIYFVACQDKQKVSGMVAGMEYPYDKDQHIFIPVENIKEIKIKKFALLNSKTKRIEINTIDGKSHKLYANIEEKDFPYQNENFAKFIEKYQNI